MRRTALLLVLLALAGCKSSMTHAWRIDEEDKDKPFLGIMVMKDGTDGEAPGLGIQRVLRDSPADDAGVRAGDVLLRFGATAVSQSADLDGALGTAQDPAWGPKIQNYREQKELLEKYGKYFGSMGAGSPLMPTSRVELTILRGTEELIIPVDLRPWGEYRRMADARLDEAAGAHEVEVTLPFIFDYSRKEIPAETWLAYRGQKVTEPVVTYQDTDILPLLVCSLFRVEQVPVAGSTRITLVHWPLQFTLDGESETSPAGGEDAYECH